MELNEIYKLLDDIGVLVFSTIHGEEVHSRAAHFNGFDEEGLYFRTMDSKPYFRQLMRTGKLTVCGVSRSDVLGHEEDGTPIFPPAYSIRLIGDIRQIAPEVIREKAKTNVALGTAVNDMSKYPAMTNGNFVMYRFKGEVFDVDFEGTRRDHKLLRTRFSFSGYPYSQAGPVISDECIGCGLCMDECTFKAIEEGSPYMIISERCDDCGSCSLVCPVDAISESQTF